MYETYVYKTHIKENGVSLLNSIFAKNFADVLSYPFSSPSTDALVISPFRESVSNSGGERINKVKKESGREKEKKRQKKPCVSREREKEIAVSLDGKTYEGPGAPVPGFDALR